MKHMGTYIAAALLTVTAAWPQASTSTVRGTVRDQAQAVIPKAMIKLTNTATNVSRTTESNEVGGYVFPNSFPGPYNLSAEFSGMQKYEVTFTVQAQLDAVIEVTLQVGTTATQVEVMDVTPLINVSNSAQAHTVERQRIEQLPINGRGYQAFFQTVPGIDSTGIPQAYGMRTNTSTTIFDGAPINEVWEGWDFGRVPGLDALEEIHVETNNSSAKFARPLTVLLTSKSGTNQLHGALFETNRNSGYGVARRRQDLFSKPPYLNRNEYGFSAGGPIMIPKLYDGRNKTFFFFAYEAVRSLSYATNSYNVPTEAMRNGDFTGLIDSAGRRITLYDPLTTTSTWSRQPLTYQGVTNRIDPNRISKLAKTLFDLTPLPNLPNVNPLIDFNLITPVATPSKQDTATLRLDHRFSSNDLIFGRFTRGRNDHLLNITPMLPGTLGDFQPFITSNRHWPNTTAAITWVHTVSPTLTNEVLVNFSRDYHFRGSGDRHTNYATSLGLPNPFGAFNWPSVTSAGVGAWPFGSQTPFWLITNYAIFQDNATKIHGKHEFQFGAGGRYELIDKSAVPTAGAFGADTQATALYNTASTPVNPVAVNQTGLGLANLELGALNYQAVFRRRWFHFRRREFTPYFQDNWKVTSRLTLNLGLRYELRSPLYDRDGTLLGFDFAKHALVTGTDVDNFVRLGETLPSILTALRSFGGNIVSYKDAGAPQKLQHTNWKEIGPHLGFAYRALDGKRSFVVRGGYRMSYYPQKLQDWVGSQSGSIPVGATFQNTVSNTALSPDGLPNYGLRSVPVYTAGVNTPDTIIDTTDTRLLARGFNVGVLDPYHTESRVQDWNLTFEKEIMNNTIIRIAYVGNHGDNQQQEVHYNDATPAYIWYQTTKTPLPTGAFAGVATRPYDKQAYGNVTLYTNSGYGNYNGAQFELERRFTRGYSFQIFYNVGNTFLLNRDTDDTQTDDAMASINTFLPGAVPADFNTRNRFLNYKRDPNTPKNLIRWNFIVELPFGKGKMFGANSKGVVNALVGGWQVAGLGNTRQGYWQLPTSNYPTSNPVEIYGDKYPIQDCQSGTCYPGYLWWNGYIPANRINSVDATGKPNGIMGVPANYKPSNAPVIPWGQTALPPNAPAGTVVSQFWDTNTVWIPLSNGTVQQTTFNDNLNPFRNQYKLAPWTWGQDASVFKFVRINERVTFRFTVDFFNIFNHPNNQNPTGNGVLSLRNSGSGARIMQLGARLSF